VSTRPRVLGALGVLGGVAFLTAFVVEIPAGWNLVRIVLWIVGGMAVALATYDGHAVVSRSLALAGTVPVVVTGLLGLLWEGLAIARDSPFSGDFGLAGFWIFLGAALATAWFGLVAARLGVVWRPAAAALTAGSLMGIAGMDRLRLTSPDNPTIFGPIAMTGLALAALAWIVLGIGVMTGRAQRPPAPAPSLTGGQIV
jgi:hypothetical protein